jgi:hypothetical protein
VKVVDGESAPEPIITHAGSDRRRALCRCNTCGCVKRCVPSFDFYASRHPATSADTLQCEACFRAALTCSGVSTDRLPEMHTEES